MVLIKLSKSNNELNKQNNVYYNKLWNTNCCSRPFHVNYLDQHIPNKTKPEMYIGNYKT